MMTENQYFIRHQLSKISKDADQAELVALRFGETRASSGIRDDIIADTIDDDFANFDAPKEEEWQARENSIDSATSRIVEELEKRGHMLGELYPFSIEGDVLKYQQSDSLLYEFLLCTSLSPGLTNGKFRHLPRIFERIVTELTADFLGPNTSFCHIGWPNELRRFKQTVLVVSQESGELDWRPNDDLPIDGPRSGDEGVDYVLWKTFGCGRPVGQMFFFGQCACGNNWETKLGDISKRFFKWFEQLKVTPGKVFAVPYVVPEVKLREESREAGIVLDRIRLLQAAQAQMHYEPDKWREKMFKAMYLVIEDST